MMRLGLFIHLYCLLVVFPTPTTVGRPTLPSQNRQLFDEEEPDDYKCYTYTVCYSPDVVDLQHDTNETPTRGGGIDANRLLRLQMRRRMDGNDSGGGGGIGGRGPDPKNSWGPDPNNNFGPEPPRRRMMRRKPRGPRGSGGGGLGLDPRLKGGGLDPRDPLTEPWTPRAMMMRMRMRMRNDEAAAAPLYHCRKEPPLGYGCHYY